MTILSFLLLGTSLLVLQTSLLPLLPGWLGRPEPLFVLVVFAAIRLGALQGAALTLLLGVLMDIFSGPYLGLYPVVYLILFLLLKGLSVNLVIQETSHQIALVLLSYLLTSSGIFLFASALAPEAALHWSWRAMLLELLVLAIFSIPLFDFFDFLLTRTSQRKTKHHSLQIQTGNRFKV